MLGGMGMLGMGMAAPLAAGMAVGGLASGVGSAVGGLASGAGSAVSGVAGAAGNVLSSGINAVSNIGGKLVEGLLGGGEEKKPPMMINNDNRKSSTSIINVLNQYDTYRKTADDSFMLPNYRREYG